MVVLTGALSTGESRGGDARGATPTVIEPDSHTVSGFKSFTNVFDVVDVAIGLILE